MSGASSLSSWVQIHTRMVAAVSPDCLVSYTYGAMLQLERSGGFDVAYTGFSDKRNVASNDPSGTAAAYDPTSRPWYREAVSAGRGIVSKPYQDIYTKKLVMTFARPVALPGGVTAVVAADVTLDGVSEVVNGIHPTPSSFAFITDKNGTLIALKKPGMDLKPATALAPALTAELISQLGPRSGRSVNIGGREAWLSAAPVAGTDWKLVVVLDAREATGILGKILLSSSGISLLIMAVAVLLLHVGGLPSPVRHTGGHGKG